MTKQYTILDLDNCISDDSWRIPKINWRIDNAFKRYHDYHSLSPFDRCANLHVIERAARLDAANFIIFTSRPLHYRAITEKWLDAFEIRFEHLMMRNDSDHRPSSAVKEAMLAWLPEYKININDIVYAVDDRPEIVDIYRKAGIVQAECVKIHDVNAYLPQYQLDLTI